MIEWQPAHEHVSGTRIDRLAHRPDIGQKVGMGQDDAFRIASGARRVLNKGDGFRVRRGRIRDRLGRRQARHRLDLLQTFGKAIKQLADRPDIVIGDQNAGLGIAHDTRLPAHMFLHPRPARRRIDRHRHASCEKDAGKRLEKPGFRRQHDGHTITWAQSALEQSLRDPPGGEIKLGIGDGQRSLSAPPQQDMRTQGVFTHMPVERFNKRTGQLRRRGARQSRQRQLLDLVGQVSRRSGGQNRGKQIRGGVHFTNQRIGELDLEYPIEPEHQFRTAETVEAQIPIKIAVERDHQRAAEIRTNLQSKVVDGAKNALGRNGFIIFDRV